MLWGGKAQCIVGKITTCGLFAARAAYSKCQIKLYSAAEPDKLCIVVRINSWEFIENIGTLLQINMYNIC